ncbi:MAG TPA: SgcJ/EcaC family oxidoreductase [Chloroflexota bacterium]|nr:SgcJ/EcaC family oxidoreductase [Chloroflexota bacterium]
MQNDTVIDDRAVEIRAAMNADEQAIRDLFRQLLEAWGRGDGPTYGALFTEDADYVAFDGSNRRGAEAIAAEHQQLFDTWLKGTRLVGQIDSLRFLGPNVALVHASGGTIFPGQRDERGRRPSIQTLVAVRRGDGWRFTAFHNTRIVRRNALQWMLYGLFSKFFDR